MSTIDFQNGFLCGMAVKGLTRSLATGGAEEDNIPAVSVGVIDVSVSDFYPCPVDACIVGVDAAAVSQVISYANYLLN